MAFDKCDYIFNQNCARNAGNMPNKYKFGSKIIFLEIVNFSSQLTTFSMSVWLVDGSSWFWSSTHPQLLCSCVWVGSWTKCFNKHCCCHDLKITVTIFQNHWILTQQQQYYKEWSWTRSCLLPHLNPILFITTPQPNLVYCHNSA